MTGFVIDASAAIEYFLETPVGLVIADMIESVPLAAPELIDAEVVSVLRGRVINRRKITVKFPRVSAPCYTRGMSSLQIKNIPDELHERLRRCASENNTTIKEIVLTGVEKELANFELRKRLAELPKIDLDFSPSESLLEERALRDAWERGEVEWPPSS